VNYSDKFGASSFQEISSPFAKGGFDVPIPENTAARPTPSGFIKINDAELLFSGTYKREGSDLIISNDVRKLVVPDYFKSETRPTLTSRDGATLSGKIVDALTGHVSYAQASGAPEPPKEIGSVAKLTGSATAIRNGVAVELKIGDKVYKGDVLQSGQGSSLGITFVDGTVFSLSSNARMVLNEMVYDPNGSSNSSLLSLVQGTITFVAGQTAKNGNMRVDTPVATMGIRGTAVLVEIGSDNGPTKFSVLVEPGNKVGSFNLYDKTTGALLGSVSQAGQVTLVTPGGIGQQATAVELPKTILDLQNERSIIKQAFEMFFPNFNDANPQGTRGVGSSVNNLADILNTGLGAAPGTVLFKQDLNLLGSPTPVTVTVTAVTTPPPIVITNATDIQPPEERGGRFTIADQIEPNSRIIPYIAGTLILDTAEGPSSMPSGFPLRSLVTLNPQTGEITYNPADFRFLADGEQAIYTFSFQSQSDEFIFVKTLTLTIDGLNDAPIFTVENFAAPVAEPGSTDSAATFSKQGTLTFTDLDFSDVASGYTVQTLGVTASGKITAVPNTAALLGFLHLDGVTKALGSTQGVITQTFSAPASAFDYLAAGETVNLAYQIRVTDADGASRTATLTVTVTGTNDAPTITGATTPVSTSGDLLEDGVLTASGVITFRDVDLSNTHTAVSALTGGTISTPLPGFNPATSMLGSLAVTVNENPNDANNIGTVSWVYSLDNLIAQRLAEGQVVTQTFTVTITDSSGATVMQPVTVTVTGANDVPTIVLTPPNTGDPVTVDVGAVTEEVDINGDGDISATGIVVFKDVDLSDTHTASFVLKSGAADPALPDYDGMLVPQIGTFALDTTLIGDNTDLIDIGVVGWTFAVDNDHPIVQSLAEGQTITQVYTITITDSSGATVSRDVTVTITGTNDAPVIDVTTPDPVQEGDAGTSALVSVDVADFVTITDVDAIDVRVPYVADTLALQTADGPAPGTGLLSDLFTIDAMNGTVGYDRAAFDYLAAGEEVTATFTFSASSGPDTVVKTITVTITGANDAPVITSNGGEALTVAVAENTAEVTTVAAADADHGATITYSIVTDSLNSPDAALFTIDPHTGVLSFIAAPDFEMPGDAGSDNSYVVQVRASDGTDEDIQTITVNVTDETEGPAGNDVVSALENTPAGLTQLSSNDQPGHTILAVHDEQHGTATIDAGNVTFLPNADFSGIASFQYDVSDNGDTVTGTATVTVNVAPLAAMPTFVTGSSASGNEDAAISLGTIDAAVADIDGSETIVLKLSGFPAGATFRVDGEVVGALATSGPDNGKWIISDPSVIESLASSVLTITLPASFNGNFTLHVDAVVTDTAMLTTGIATDIKTFGRDVSVFVDPVNDAPVLDLDGTDVSGTGFAAAVENDGSLSAIADMPSLADIDHAILDGVRVVLADGQAGDFLVVFDGSEPGGETGELDNGVTWVISGAAGDPDEPLTITFAGGFSPADYQFALTQVMFGSDGGETGQRHVEVTANDGSDDSNVATATIDVVDDNTPPNAVDDTIVLRNDFFAVASTLTSNDSDPDSGDAVTISGLSHGATLAEEIPGGFKVQGLYGTLYVYSDDATNPIGGSINAGDYFFYLGQDINGDPIANNPADVLQPDALLSDSFTYTISDGHGGTDTANIALTIEPSPVHVTVLSSAGVDVTPAKLWSYLYDNDLIAISPNGLTIQVPDDIGPGVTLVTIDAQDLTYTPPNPNLPIDDVTLTGGYIKNVYVSYDADGAGSGSAVSLYEATHFNIPAQAFYAAVIDDTPDSFEALLATYAYLSNGGTGPDVLFGGNRTDVIDTGGGADIVDAGGGNDVILVHDDNGWDIDGGEGIDTIQFVGEIHTGQVPPGSDAHNIEIIDLNTTHADTLLIDGEGAASINEEDKLYVLGDGSDLVNFENSATYPNHYWHHAEVSGENGFELYQFTTGIGPNADVAAEVFVQDGIGVNFAPMLSGDEISVVELNDGVTIVLDLMLADYYEAGALTITAEAMNGSVTAVVGGEPTSLDPLDGGFTGTLTSINAVFEAGVTYTPDNYQDQVPLNDIVTVKVTDSHGLSDELSFVFQQSGPGGVALVGTGGKDLIFSTDGNDTLTGLAGRDNFVFSPNNGQDSIEDFQTGIDRIDLRQFAGEVDASTIDDWLVNHASPSGNGNDTLITFDPNNSILVKNVAALTANDFILHPGGQGI
jgi:VCBS repeat-containing protein